MILEVGEEPPEQEPISSNRGRYVVTLGRTSAAMLTIPAR